MAGSANDIKIVPINCSWQIEHESNYDFSTITSYDGTSFKVPDKDGLVAIVAFDLNATSTLPTPGAGERLIEVDVTGSDAATNAGLAATAIDADGAFSSSASGSVVSIIGSAVGRADDPTDTDSLVGITICRRGKNYDLGLLDGDVEPSTTIEKLSITSHQTGLTPQASLFQGATGEVTTVMQETGKAKLKEIFRSIGGTFTPGGGTEIVGVGDSRQGANLLIDAARLVFKPVGSVDDTENFGYALAVPNLDSIVYSGENPRVANVTWAAFLDSGLQSDIRYFFIGDIFQAGVRI